MLENTTTPTASQEQNTAAAHAATSFPQPEHMREAALYYAAHGLHIIPVYSVIDGQCTCGDPHTDDPKQIGKHPATPHGYKDATTDPAKITEWFSGELRNIGVATGDVSGVFSVDIDGELGEENLREMEKQYGAVPTTLEDRTGRGRQLFFQFPKGSGITGFSRSDLKIDIRANGNYTILPPSRHSNGKIYEWLDPVTPIAPAPQFIIDYAQTKGESFRPKHPNANKRISNNNQTLLNANLPEYLRGLTGIDIGAMISPPPSWTAEAERDLRAALTFIPPIGNDNWEDVAFPLKWLSSAWGDKLCWDIVDEWSKSMKTEDQHHYNPIKNFSRWKSLAPHHPNPKTTRTLFSLAQSRGWKPVAYNADGGSTPNGKINETDSQKTRLITIAMDAELWHDADGNSFATVAVDDHLETYQVKSGGFRRWLLGAYGDRHSFRIGSKIVPSSPSAQAQTEAFATIEALCARGQTYTPVIRIGRSADKDKVYLDLGTPDWSVVEIDATDWRMLPKAPIKFIRPNGMRPLPVPVQGGTIAELKPFLNVSKDDFDLIVGFVSMSFNPSGPYPILNVNSEHGSGKTTVTRAIRSLIDPNKAHIRPAPKNEDDLIIASNNSWMLAFDNVSHIPENMADAMCRISSGTGFGKRTLYENTEETLISVCRPQIINGIPDLATRADFADRAIIISLPSIPHDKRKDEEVFWQEFNVAHPRILGALLDGVVCSLRRRKIIKLSNPPRMADFALWVEAAAPAFGWQDGHFLKIYQLNRKQIVEMLLENDTFATALITFMAPKLIWTGSSTDLYKTLPAPALDARYWPKNPAHLSGRLRRLAPALRASGFEIEFGERTSNLRPISIRNKR